MAGPRQTSFAGGELDPELWNATWLGKYSSALRRMFNFFPTVKGAALNRSGTGLVADRAGKDHATAAWLIPFVYSEMPNQAYAIELGHLYARFIVNGGYVAPNPAEYSAWSNAATYGLNDWVTSAGVAYRSLQAGNLNHAPAGLFPWWEPSTAYEISTPYAAADLARLQWAQQGDILTLTRHGYEPQELRRYAHARWAIGPVSFDVLPYDFGAYGLQVPTLKSPLPAGTPAEPAMEWRWFVSEIREYADGSIVETSAFEIEDSATYAGIPPVPTATPLPSKLAVWQDLAQTVEVFEHGGLVIDPGYRVTALRIYRGRGTIDGFVGETLIGPGGRSTFVDIGETPDLSQARRQGLNPFKVRDMLGAVLRTEQPAAVAFYEGRRVFGNLAVGATPYRPALVLASAGDAWTDFDKRAVSLDEHAVVFQLTSRLREEVRWLLGGPKLLVGTNSSVWAVGGAGGEPLSPALSIDAKVQRETGSAWLRPLVAGDEVLYVGARANAVVELFYDDNRGKYVGGELQVLSDHLFKKYSIVDWAYAHEPWRIAWLVRSDGTLLSLTYLRQLDVWGWAVHELGGDGAAESVTVIPEGAEDVVYVVVRRTIVGVTRRYIERFTTRQVEDARLGVFLDSALSFDGRYLGPLAAQVFDGGDGFDVDSEPWLFIGGWHFNAGDVGGAVVLDPDGAACKLEIIGFTSAESVRVRVIGPGAVPAAYQGYPGAVDFSTTIKTVTGLGHLEGQTVAALADGAVARDLVVAGGEVELPVHASIVHVGLPYVSELELLDLAGSADARAKEKIVVRVDVELANSRGAISVGENLATLAPWQPTDELDQVGDGPVPLYDGTAEVRPHASWNKRGRATVQQADPLPCAVVGVTRHVEMGGGDS